MEDDHEEHGTGMYEEEQEEHELPDDVEAEAEGEEEEGDENAAVGDVDVDAEIQILDKTQEEDSAKREAEKKERITTPFMTKYERARILGTRALQISMNAPVMVNLKGETDPLRIALMELQQKKIP
eukprot:TRINITY_DN553_c0_g1_i3.p2 TRINITY_DN553_c0_g1~~TRINITY_DN553_c0_g1_i3.p2  ORF type:complete len:148 (+),score=51.93 TRINITY_DN553_c0_g1_i3:69-446(+)